MFVRCEGTYDEGKYINLSHVSMVETRKSYNHNTKDYIYSLKAKIDDTWYSVMEGTREQCEQRLEELLYGREKI